MKKIILATLLLLPLFLSAENQSLTVTFTDLQSSDGKVLVTIFKGKEGYTQQKPYLTKSLDIEKNVAVWKLDTIPAGEYIIAAVHDENINGKMDFSETTRMPEEGFAFSNNAQPKIGPPNPDEMCFTIKQNENAAQTIKMVYFGMKPKTLKEVEIVGDRKQFVKVDADKTTYQVKENAALSGGSMRDAVRKLPGVLLSPSGDLNLNGKNVSVYMDGVPQKLSGSDLKSFMESLPANTIEKIELIENPGAAYEANNSGAVVNIITRTTSPANFSGTLNMHYGFSQNHKLSPSLMLNGRKKKVNWQLQTGYNWQQQDQWNDVQQTFTSSTPPVIFAHSSTQENLNRNFYFRPMLNYRLTENSYIVFNYNLNSANNQRITDSELKTQNLPLPINFKSKFENPEVNRNNEFVLKYKTMLDTLGRSVQITGYYSNYYKNSDGLSSQMTQQPVYGISNINLNLDNAYGKVDFEIPFKKISLNTGAKYNFTKAHNVGKYNYNSASAAIFSQPTYNEKIDFTYDEQNIAAYAEARKTFGKLSATLGVRLEDLKYNSLAVNIDTVDGRVTSVFPTANLLYQLIPNVNVSARYSRKIAMPAYDQLDPNVNGYFDAFSSSAGNQQLKPNFYDNYSLSISAFNYASIGSYLSYSKNISLLSTDVEPDYKTIKTSKNYENIKMYGVYLSLPVPFGLITKGADFFKQPMNMANMSYAHVFLSCNFNDIKDYPYPAGQAHKPLWMFNLNTHIALPYQFTLDANWFHMFKGNFQIYTFQKPMNYWQVDLSRKFLKDKLEITAEAMQMTAQNIGFNMPNLKTDVYMRNDGVTYWLKLSYRFGSFKSKEETQIEVEKRELQGGGVNVRK